MKRVELFYDVLSPYSWVGFEVMCRYESVWNINLELRPFLLGALSRRTGRKGFTITKERSRYHGKDILRVARHFEIPLRIPQNLLQTLARGSLPAMRLLTAVSIKEPAALEEVSRQLWLRAWGRDEDIVEPDSLRAAVEAAGIEADAAGRLVEAVHSAEVKAALRATTERAVKMRIFGAPTFVAHVEGGPEILFGGDRISLLADVLGEVYCGPMNHLSKLK